MISHLTKHVLMGRKKPATTPGSWTTIVWSIIPLIPSHPWKVMVQKQIFAMCKPWPWRWWCFVWNVIKSQYGSEELYPRHGFGYVCTLTLTLEIWPWVKVMTHPWVMENNCVKYYPDLIWQWGVMARTWILVFVHCDLDIRHMIFSQGHGTPLGHRR